MATRTALIAGHNRTTEVAESVPALPSHELIAARAYEIYLREGSVDGHEIDHWMRAQIELGEEVGLKTSDDHTPN